MTRVRRSSQQWLAGKLGRPLCGRQAASGGQWLAEQVAEAVVMALRLQARGFSEVWLHYRRGEVLVSEERALEGYELVSGLAIPTGKGKAELLEWVGERLRRVPCCP